MNNDEVNTEELKQFVIDGLERDWLRPAFNDEGAIVMFPVPGDNPIWDAAINELDDVIADLAEKGLVEVDGINEDGEFLFKPTEKGMRELKSY